MRRIALALLLLQALPDTPLMAQDTFPPPGTPAPRPSASVLMQAFAPVDERIGSWIAAGYYAGASLRLEQDGRTLWQRTWGNQRDDSVEFIASAGKWLAAATILSVVDAGRLSLDDQVTTILPAIGGRAGAARLRQLLSHTSGYAPYQPADRPSDQYQTLAEAVSAITPLPLAHEPGTVFAYGGLAMQVAGRMAEVASGEGFESLFQHAIAIPLGMTATHFTPVDGGFGHSPMLAGGARSTLADYSRFLAMILADGVIDGRRVLSLAALHAMLADQVGTAAIPADNFVATVRGAGHHGIYGLGVWRELEDEHGQALVVSSPSWAGAYPWIDRRHRLSAMFLAHVQGPVVGHFDLFNPMTASADLPVLIDRALCTLEAARAPEHAGQ